MSNHDKESINDQIEFFTQIYDKYIPDLYRIAKSRLLIEDDIYDAIQETGYKLYINANKIKDKNKIKIWLIKVLINECNKIYKNKKKEQKLQEKMIVNQSKEMKLDRDDNLDFEILINKLKLEDRTILALYYASNLTTKEIAKILKKNENTIRSKIKRAKDFIRANLKESEAKVNGK